MVDRTNSRLLSSLSICTVLLSIGLSLVWPIHTVYIHEKLGRSMPEAGAVLLASSGTAFIGNLLGGFLFERWGGKKTVLLGIAGSAVSVTGMGQASDFFGYSVLLVLLGFFGGLVYPVINAIAVVGCPGGEQKAVNRIFVTQNMGMAIGTAAGGFIAARSLHAVFFVNAAIYVLFFVLFRFLIQEPGKVKAGKSNLEAALSERMSGRSNKMAVGIFCFGYVVTWMCYSQWAAIVPIQSQVKGISFTLYSLLWTINGCQILLAQPVKTWMERRFPFSLHAQITVGTLFLTAGLLAAGCAEAYWQFAAAMVVLTCGEILVFPSVPARAVEMADDGAKGMVLGYTTAASTVGKMLGPFAGGVIYERGSGQSLFTIMSLICLSTVMCYLYAEKLIISRKKKEPSTVDI